MPKPNYIELLEGELRIPIVYEDRSVLAIDKPSGWMLAPDDWEQTSRNLQLAIISSIHGGEFWAKSRNLKYLRFVHRIDAETSGLVLFSKSAGAMPVYSKLFESRQMEKRYLAVVKGRPKTSEWVSKAKLGPDNIRKGMMRLDAREGKEAETHFKLMGSVGEQSLIEARPITGRTHQIRVHLNQAGLPIIGDTLYGNAGKSPSKAFPMGLRAVGLEFKDPFTRKLIRIRAAEEEFLEAFGMSGVYKQEPGQGRREGKANDERVVGGNKETGAKKRQTDEVPSKS